MKTAINLSKEEANALLLSISRMSEHDLDQYVLAGNFIVGRVKFTRRKTQLPKLANGWKLKITFPPLKSSRRTIFIIPEQSHKEQLWEEGQYTWAKRFNMPEKYIHKWLLVRNKLKHSLISQTVNCLNCPMLTEAYLSFDLNFNESETATWMSVYRVTDNLGVLPRASLSKIMKELVADQSGE